MPHTSSPTPFYVLPNRLANGPTNMADDMALLQLFPEPEAIRFRHYEWTYPSWTFGCNIPFTQVRETIGTRNPNYCRRPTTGGIVRHELDWTYSFVIPASHTFSEKDPLEIYQSVHEVLGHTLLQHGCAVILATDSEDYNSIEELYGSFRRSAKRCFDHTETNDIILAQTKHKVAGLALKRTQHGLLVQGSINKLVTGPLPWDLIQHTFTQGLAALLKAQLKHISWPAYPTEAICQLRNQMAAPSWNEKTFS